MSISNVIERDQTLYIYNDRGEQSGMVALHGRGPNDRLRGQTSPEVNVLRDGAIYAYDEQGMQIRPMPA